MPYSLEQADILIDLAKQTLYLPKLNKFYVISSGKNGIGEQENTGKTPRGWHCVAQKIGTNAPKNSVFIARQATGEIYDQDLAQQFPERDWILSRILWLAGLEVGFNQGEGCDTFNRYIYIHGTPETEPMGIPMSHGCIRMKNDEVIELFELIPEQALVYISEHSLDESILDSERSV
ncbi:L,D-transpeptidase [Acinetobacter suaedae]|uniref:L,D-transpeptidase n=1 Tax=Acinetobacter suaedae TaxID=2609668 RepID=A0A5P1UT65_9GAMM|nr:cell wall-recycling L,D-carboxypeptidase ElsL [Acinetobacter sp. C16S1]QER38797.1 L,D-transpeptidase [Acinetobacter sp. C16S1]